MRITTGAYKGRVIRTVRDLSVRPVTDRVRQTIFNILAHRTTVEGATVLDLFAGSGILGIEALSRGAAHVTFVEQKDEPVRLLEETLRALGCEGSSQVLAMDAAHYLETSSASFDIVFADPPYAYELTAGIPSLIFQRNMLRRNGFLLIEHSTDLRFESTQAYTAGPEKRFGRTIVTFFRHPESPA